MSVIQLTSENFEREVLHASKPVLVEFQAAWCGPCQALAPVVESISEEISDVKFGKVDVDQEKELAAEFHIMSVPTLLLFRDGKGEKRSVGLQKKEDIRKLLGLGCL